MDISHSLIMSMLLKTHNGLTLLSRVCIEIEDQRKLEFKVQQTSLDISWMDNLE